MSEQDAKLDEFAESDHPISDDTHRVGDRIKIIKGTKPDEVMKEPVDGAEKYLVVGTFTGEEKKYAVDDGAPRGKPEDVIMIMDGSKSGRVYPGGHGILGSTMASIRPDGINPTFLYFFLERAFNRINSATKGSAVPHTDKDFVRSLKYKITSLDEQRKIASVLYTVDQAVQNTKKVIEQTKRLRTGIVQSIFRSGHKTHESYQKTGSGEYSEMWDLVKFEDLIEDTRYGTDNKSNTEGKGYPTLRIPNVVEKRVTTDDLKHTPLDDDEFERLRLEDDDILVIRTNGNPNYVGRCATFTERTDSLVFASYLIRIRVDESRIRPAFVREFLNSQRGQNDMSGWVRSSAGNYNLTVAAIEKFDVPVPSLDEQEAIIKKIDSVEGLVQMNYQHLGQLQRLKQGLMQDLLSGEVRTYNKGIELVDDVFQHG